MIGALYVLGNVYLVPVVGTGLAVVIVLVGLMAGSLMIDQFGWFASKRTQFRGPVDGLARHDCGGCANSRLLSTLRIGECHRVIGKVF